jgi:hypothetical protein
MNAKYDDSNLLAKLLGHLGGFVKLAEAMRGDDAPSKLALRLPIGETFLREANGTRGAFLPR